MSTWVEQRTSTQFWGRFFVCDPTRNKLVSFFWVKNSICDSFSNAWKSFRLFSILECNELIILYIACWCDYSDGAILRTRSRNNCVMVELVFFPRKINTFFVFSTSLGALCFNARITCCFCFFGRVTLKFFACLFTRVIFCDGTNEIESNLIARSQCIIVEFILIASTG